MKKAVLGAIITTVFGCGMLAGPVNAAPVKPLKVRISTEDGKPTIKVKRKLSFLVSCSKTCGMRIKFDLVTPVGFGGGKLAGGAKALETKVVSFSLNNASLRTLRRHYFGSRLSIKVRARDVATGKVQTKTRVYRFRK